MIIWSLLVWKLKKAFYASLLVLVIILPFNITLQLNGMYDQYVDGIAVNYLVPTISIIDVFAILSLYSFIFDYASKLKSMLSKHFLLFIGLAIGYLLMHIFLFSNMLTILLSARYLIYMLLFAAVFCAVYSKKYFYTLACVSIANGLLQIIIGVLQYLNGKSLGLKFLGESVITNGIYGTSFVRLADNEYMRAYGTFPHPNMLSGYLLFVLIFLVFLPVASIPFKWVKYISAGIISIGALFTFSRVSIMLICLVWVVKIVVTLTKLLKAKQKPTIATVKSHFILWQMLLVVLVVLAVFVVLACTGVLAGLYQHFLTLALGGGISVSDRAALNNVAVEVIRNHPLFGVGIGNFIKAMGSDAPFTSGGFSLMQPVHNVFLLVVAENGITAGVVFFSILLVLLYKLLRLTYFPRYLSVLITFVILAISLSDHYLVTLPQGNILLIYTLILLCAWKSVTHNRVAKLN